MRTRRARASIVATIALTLAVGAPVALPRGANAAVPNYDPPTCPASGVNLVAADPVDGTTLKVARIAVPKAGGTEKWDLKWDPWLCNKTATSYNSVAVKAEFFSGTTLTKTVNAALKRRTGSDQHLINYTLPSGSNALGGYWRPGEAAGTSSPTLFSYPLPTSIKFTITLKPTSSSSTGIVTRTATYSVANQTTPGPLAAFFFPLRQTSLPSGAYYNVGYHDDMNWHNRYALDIGAVRWDSSAGKWTPYRKPNASNPSDPINDHHNPESWLIWGNAVRAMSDGEVVACVRGAPDNDPWIVDGAEDATAKANQVDVFPGGNYLWIRTGTQTQVIAHLQQNSIPFSLCPFSDNAEHKLADPYSNAPGDATYQVHAGQFLGYIGNSGNTSNPHTHIESIMGTSQAWGGGNAEYGYGSDSRPMNFVNVKVQPHLGTNAVSANWNELTSARVIPYNTLISPNDCGYLPSSYVGKKEVVQIATTAACWAQMYNAMIQAGFRPVHYDSHPSGTTRKITTVWRPSDGTSWVLQHGLDAAGLQSAHNTYTALSGWRYLNLQSYTTNGAVRYAVIFVKQPGSGQHAQAAMSLATFTSVFNTKSSQGYRMVDYSVVVVGGARLYTGLWAYAPAIGSYVVKDVTAANYQSEYNTQTAAGRMPVSLDGYELGGTPYLATIWYGSPGGGWAAQHAMTAATAASAETTNLASNRYARAFTEYGTSGTFAAVWRPAPNTSITSGPSGSTSSHTATFGFSATSDTLATFECKLDGGSYAPCTSTRTYSSLAAGSHTFSVRARDFQGVYDATPATRTWTIT